MLLRIAYALAIYEPNLVVYHGGDYTLYRIGAEEIASGDLSFSHDLFLLRPPLFPLMAALLGVDSLAVIAVNILLASCIIPLTWRLARQLSMSRRMSLLAALIVALDPTSLVYSGILAPEPLANVLLAAGFVCLFAVRSAGTPRQAPLPMNKDSTLRPSGTAPASPAKKRAFYPSSRAAASHATPPRPLRRSNGRRPPPSAAR